jgi:predicted MFS family arabinose efflux permease
MTKRLKVVLPNPWKSLRLLFEKDTSLVLSVSAIFYIVYYITQASIPALLSHIYGFNATKIGLCYFAIGSGVMLGTYINGMISLMRPPTT